MIYLPFGCSFSNLIKSSILKMVIAASVANLNEFYNISYFKLFVLLIAGSNTPALKLFLTFPLKISNPVCFWF